MKKVQKTDLEMQAISSLVLAEIDPSQFKCGAGKHSIMGYSHDAAQERIDHDLKRIKKYRQWLETQEGKIDQDVVNSYDYWLKDYERLVSDAQKWLVQKDRLDAAKREISVPKPSFGK